MRNEITSIAPWQTAKILAALAFVFTLAVFGLFFLFALVGRSNTFFSAMNSGLGLWFLFLSPILYALSTYIVTVMLCYLYNFLASKLGGIRFDTQS